MCGICGIVSARNCKFRAGVQCICNLLNRGYDGMGVSTMVEGQIVTDKFVNFNVEDALHNFDALYKTHVGTISIFHSRWRTTGEKSIVNCHPHNSEHFSLVHNGIIENYRELREKYALKTYSTTDSEVIVQLIEHNYKLTKSVQKAIKDTLSEVEGSYALAILCNETPETLYVVRHLSPLLVAISTDSQTAMIASEVSGFSSEMSKYFVLPEREICTVAVESGSVVISGDHDLVAIPDRITEKSCTFEHHTLSEIHDQIGYSAKCEKLDSVDNILFIGCGSSYHAALYGQLLFKSICNARAIDGSEFSVEDIPGTATVAILISQSGETRDLLSCVEILKAKAIATIALVNVETSALALQCDRVLPMKCGREHGVAATKSFTSALMLIEALRGLKLTFNVKSIIYDNVTQVIKLAHILSKASSMFILGKSACEIVAKEASLKIKELCYIHAEAYNSSSLKHGPYALIEDKFPVIVLVQKTDVVKSQILLDELKCRNAFTVVLCPAECHFSDDVYDFKISVNENTTYSYVIIMQMLAYYIAVSKGINPDYPRNLAKTVTVD